MLNRKHRILTRSIRFYRNKFFYSFWEQLNKLSTYGLNYHAGFHLVSGELGVIKLIRDNFGPSPLVLDVGACTGGYSTSLLEIIPAPKHLYVFEPLKANYEVLQKNIIVNSHISLLNLGLSNKEEYLTLNSSSSVDSSASLYENINGNLLTEKAHFTTLDDFISKHKIDFIDFLKLDTEGHEFNILEGGRSNLKNQNIKAIQFEFGPYNIESRTYFKDFYDLLSPYYNLFKIVNNGLVEIKGYSPYLEKFITSNYLAVLKSCPFGY